MTFPEPNQTQLELEMGIAGKRKAASHNNPYLDIARKFADKFTSEWRGAVKYAEALRRYPEYKPENAITSDDVRAGIGLIPAPRHGTQWKDKYKNNWMGSVFLTGEYIRTPILWTSGATGSHGRGVSIWVKKN